MQEIFKESMDKLNSILMYLDHQLGTVSLTKEEIDSLGGVKNTVEPSHKILEEQKGADKKCKKKEKSKDEKVEQKEEKPQEKHEEKQEEKHEEKHEEKKDKKNKKEKKAEGEGEGKKEEKKKHEQKKGMEPKEIFKLCDLRVGYVEECTILEGFNDIYSLVIDLGEESKRRIGTGLRNHVPMEKIKNTKIIVFSNLKPKKFGKDFESNGMILTASSKDGESKIYELIRPDENAKPGEKVYLDGTELDPKKEATISPKRFGQILDNLKTNEECFCIYDGTKLRTESGFVKAPLKNAPIS